tara:strand:- start:133 stop:435 length:303 start_codon:yes stop_codon:yes gene_type:complete
MDNKSFEQQLQSLNNDVARYKKTIAQYEYLMSYRGYVFATRTYTEMVQQVDYARRHLGYARREIEKLEQKYYSQFPLTREQYGCVGFPTGLTNLDGSDRF